MQPEQELKHIEAGQIRSLNFNVAIPYAQILHFKKLELIKRLDRKPRGKRITIFNKTNPK